MSSTANNNHVPPPPFHRPTRSRSSPVLTSKFPPPPPPRRHRQPQDDGTCHVYPLRRCSANKKSETSKKTYTANGESNLSHRARGLDLDACSSYSRNGKDTTKALSRRSSHSSSAPSRRDRNQEGRQGKNSNPSKQSPREDRSSTATLIAEPQRTQRSTSRAKSSSKSIGHSVDNTFVRRHTVDGPGRTISRRNSTQTFSHELRLCNSNGTETKESVIPTMSPRRRNGPMHSLSSMTLTTAFLTSRRCNGEAQVPQMTLFSPSRGRSKSFSSIINQAGQVSISSSRRIISTPQNTDRQSEQKSIFSRGRSRSKPRNNALTEDETNDKSILSARRSFANSLTRRRSLSRNASRVLSVTSTMDGNHDAEPCMQPYEALFNNETEMCNYHPSLVWR